MDKNLKANLGDQAVKGAVLGAVAYFADRVGMSAEQVAVVMPIVLMGLAWLSTKIGDKGTTVIFRVVQEVAKAQTSSKKSK